MNEDNFAPQPAPQPTQQPVPQAQSLNLPQVILGVLTKPVSTIKSNLGNFTNFSNSAVLLGVVTLILTLTTLITTIVNTVVERSYSLFAGEVKTKIDFDNLSDLDWVHALGAPILIYLAVVLILSGLFFGVAKLFKCQQVSYSRLVGIYAAALVPLAIVNLVSLLGLLYAPIGIIVTLIGSAYCWYIFYEGASLEVPLDGDRKVLYHLTCFTIAIVAIFIVLRIVVGSTLGSFNLNISNFL